MSSIRKILMVIPLLVLSSCSVSRNNPNLPDNPPEVDNEIPESIELNDLSIPKEIIPENYKFSISYEKTVYVKTIKELNSAIDDLTSTPTRIVLEAGVYDVGSGLSIDYKGSGLTIAGEAGAVITSTSTNKEIDLLSIDPNSRNICIDSLEFKGVTCKYATGIAMWDGGQNNIVISNNKFHDIKTTKVSDDYGTNAILMMGEAKTPISNIFIYQNEVYDMTLGYAEAISASGNCESVFVVKNNLHDITNIGIDFYGNAGYCATASLDQPRNCVASLNTLSHCNSPYADCAGIYVDGAKDSFVINNEVSYSQYGIEIGAEEKTSYPTNSIAVMGNTLKNNTVNDIRIGGYDESSTGWVMNTEIYQNKLESSCQAITISKVDGIKIHNNEISSSKVLDIEFTKEYSKNISFYDNIIPTNARFVENGKSISIDDFTKEHGV